MNGTFTMNMFHYIRFSFVEGNKLVCFVNSESSFKVHVIVHDFLWYTLTPYVSARHKSNCALNFRILSVLTFALQILKPGKLWNNTISHIKLKLPCFYFWTDFWIKKKNLLQFWMTFNWMGNINHNKIFT